MSLNLACRRAKAGADARPFAFAFQVNPAEPRFYGNGRGQINASGLFRSNVEKARP